MRRGQPLPEETKRKMRESHNRTMKRLRENKATMLEVSLIQAEYGCDESEARRIIREQRHSLGKDFQ